MKSIRQHETVEWDLNRDTDEMFCPLCGESCLAYLGLHFRQSHNVIFYSATNNYYCYCGEPFKLASEFYAHATEGGKKHYLEFLMGKFDHNEYRAKHVET